MPADVAGDTSAESEGVATRGKSAKVTIVPGFSKFQTIFSVWSLETDVALAAGSLDESENGMMPANASGIPTPIAAHRAYARTKERVIK